jgi:F-type H+-transporting ATPase subunit delta
MSDNGQKSDQAQLDIGARRLARVYATALLDAAAKQNVPAASVVKELDSLIDDVLKQDADLLMLFTGAAVGRKAGRAVIEKGFTGRATPLFLNFLLVLSAHDRLALLPAIRSAAHDLENERLRRKPVQVWSAVPLTEAETTRLAGTVRDRFQFEPILQSHVDPAVLGGLKVRIGDLQMDDTVRTRLDNLRTQIIARSSYEIQSRRDRFRTE